MCLYVYVTDIAMCERLLITCLPCRAAQLLVEDYDDGPIAEDDTVLSHVHIVRSCVVYECVFGVCVRAHQNSG